MRRVRALLLVLVFTAGVPATAMQRCGDDVDGRAVPCACGDLLVSSRRLDADAVTAAPCPGNGLLVDAPGTVTLDLGERTLAGSGQGVGVLVLRGHLALVGPGAIEGFETGVLARGADRLESARDVRIAGNRLDGVSAQGDGFVIVGVVAEGNGRDGFVLGGRGYALDGNRASRNGRDGFHLSGTGAHVGGGLGNEAQENVGAGFAVAGRMHQLLGATAHGNGGDGLGGTIGLTLIAGARTDANLGSGVAAHGAGLRIQDTEAFGNHGYGIWLDGANGVDGGGNRGGGNDGLTRNANGPPAMYSGWMAGLVQCRIGDEACR